MWFAAAIEFERQNSQGTGSGDRISRQYRYCDIVSGHSRLLNDYFVENLVYDETLFRRRFRLSRHLFLRILHTLQQPRTKMSEISAEISAIFHVSVANEAKFETLSRLLEKSPKIDKYRRNIGIWAIFRWKFRHVGDTRGGKFLRHFLGDISVDISAGFLCG